MSSGEQQRHEQRRSEHDDVRDGQSLVRCRKAGYDSRDTEDAQCDLYAGGPVRESPAAKAPHDPHDKREDQNGRYRQAVKTVTEIDGLSGRLHGRAFGKRRAQRNYGQTKSKEDIFQVHEAFSLGRTLISGLLCHS